MLKTYPSWVDDGSPIPDDFGHGQAAVDFIKGLRHPKAKLKGKVRPFQLDPWMERIVRRIYGPRHEDGTRIVKTVFLMVGRGNRKTALGAALALLHTIGPERQNVGQVICAAADQKQARIAYEEAANILAEDPRLNPIAEVLSYRNRIVNRKNKAWLEAISADGATQHGRTPAFVLADELHAWKKRDLWEALKTGLVKTPGALCVIITTAGRGQENIAFDQYDYARRVASGLITDETWLPILFETDPEADWRDEGNWHLSNPGLKLGYPDLPGLRQLAREAENKPSERESFRQLHLNCWLDHSTAPFADMAQWDRGSAPIDLDALKGRPCWVGVDMSTRVDLTAVVAAFRGDEPGSFIVLARAFVPEENLAKKADVDGVPYPRWAEEGFIVPTPGNVIDPRAIENYCRELHATYDVQEFGFDAAYAGAVMGPLNDDRLPVVTIRQYWSVQSPALNVLEAAIISGKLQHGGNPVLRWCMSNVAVHTDAHDNRVMHKHKSTGRIDLAVALWMAISRADACEMTGSFLASPNFNVSDMFMDF